MCVPEMLPLIAATAICHKLELLTYNIKDFKYIDGIRLYKPA